MALSRRQQTMRVLFPRPLEQRPKRIARAHQLGLGEGWVRVGRCALELAHASGCEECGGFVCQRCDAWTSANGGDGSCCARCS